MASPLDVSGLYAWYKATTFALLEGEQCGDWLDSSGNGQNLTVGPSGGFPKYRANQLAGYPAIEFNGAGIFSRAGASFLWGTNLANHTIFLVFNSNSVAAFDGQMAGNNGGSQSEGLRVGSSSKLVKRITYTGSPFTSTVSSIGSLTAGTWFYCYGCQTNGGHIGISLHGEAESTVAFAATRDSSFQPFYFGVDEGDFWNGGLIAECFVYNSDLSGSDKTLLNTYLRDKYFGETPGQQEQVRDVLSRRLWTRRRPSGLYEVTAPLWMLDADIGERIAAELRTGPSPAGAGWGGKKWSRAQFTIQSIEPDPASNSCKLVVLDRRSLDVLLWDTARTNKRNEHARQSGVARLQRGIGYTFARPSKAWIPNPADPTSIVEAAQTERAINQQGEFLEAARTNAITRSSFVSGTTGLTLAGTGTNGSAIAVDTAELLFDQLTSVNSLKFTAGNPHAAELRVTFPATASKSANTIVVVSFDYRNDSGEGLYWRLQRSIDSWYWNDTSGAWQSGSVDNALTVHTDRDPGDRQASKAIDVGGSATTLTLSVFLQTGGTASRVSHLYHVQLEEGRYPTSRIVTDGAEVTRQKTELSHEVTTALKLFDPALGAYLCAFLPDWSSADLGSSDDRYLYWMETAGGSDHDALYYDASAGAFVLERKVGGSTYTASKTATVTRGVQVSLGARWTGVKAELDLPAYSLSVFVDGVKGTDATAAAPTFTSPETWFRGSNGSLALQADGAIADLAVLPRAPTDEEMAAGV